MNLKLASRELWHLQIKETVFKSFAASASEEAWARCRVTFRYPCLEEWHKRVRIKTYQLEAHLYYLALWSF